MANVKSKIIPVAKRIIYHSNLDLTDKSIIADFAFHFANYSRFTKDYPLRTSLKVIDGWKMISFPVEYPIAHYECDENSRFALDGELYLNSFVEDITISIVQSGRQVLFGSKTSDFNITDFEASVIVYYTDHAGINRVIYQNDLFELLLKKPKLVVSPEGILIFFTEKEIIATAGCNNGYYWISDYCLDMKDRIVKDIKVLKNYCKIILVDDNGIEHNFKLKFSFNMASYQMLIPKVTEL